MRIILLIIIVFTSFVTAQTDWNRWVKAEVDYSIKLDGVDKHGDSSSTMSILKDGYSFLISDLDGDNCPFYPTCSSFYVQSVSQTNIIKGTLMFADRFTRDSNLFKTNEHYPIHVSGKLYDPSYNYQLEDSTIIFYSREKLVK
jgi:putative component of membrane protein insertase Oxa1/YidC/SpoIIIJ protein YidD